MLQFVPNGPEIPFEIQQALEEDRLVFFCGSGISMYSGLPDFKGMVKNVFTSCHSALQEQVKCESCDQSILITNHPGEEAFFAGHYDKSLEILESQLAPYVMRKHIIEGLSIEIESPEYKDQPIIHKAILDLSRRNDGQGYRLVTTNFDDRFELAGLEKALVHAAPRLAPPRPNEWFHATFLHGIIDKEYDPEGKNLILTSSDFGKAYLRDAWAARFVIELFREYTILFLGYSLNDPTMAYLVDALAADMGSNRQFKKAFAFGSYNGTIEDKKRQEQRWQSKKIQLLPYEVKNSDYSLLNNTLIEWARKKVGGLNSRISMAIETTQKPYTEAAKGEVKNVVWALSKSDGTVAKAFAKADPSPHISWLQPLSENLISSYRPFESPYSLLNMPSPPEEDENGLLRYPVAPLFGYRASSLEGLRITNISFELAKWVACHLEDQELINWTIKNHGILHPDLTRQFVHKLQNLTSLPKAKFWQIIISGVTKPSILDQVINIFELTDPYINSALLYKGILLAAKPYLIVKEPVRYIFDESKDTITGSPAQLRELVEFEIGLSDPDQLEYYIQTLSEKEVLDKTLVELSEEFTSLLTEVIKLAEWAEITYIIEYSHLFRPSISSHGQNSDPKSWTLLVELCKRSFDSCGVHSPRKAYSLANRWLSLAQDGDYALFYRLALYAYTTLKELPSDIVVNLIVDSNYNILWRDDCRREILQFFKHRGSDIDPEILQSLVDKILEGPPEEPSKDE